MTQGPPPDRSRLIADPALGGRALSDALVAATDAWISGLAANAFGDHHGLALVAIGGYGRGELSPFSDLDLLLLHVGDLPAGVADALWYPMWDSGAQLGHGVRTVGETIDLARNDLATATGLCTTRLLAGDPLLASRLDRDFAQLASRHGQRWLRQLSADRTERWSQCGDARFDLEPDLKNGRGALRDAHALGWLATWGAATPEASDPALNQAADQLLTARIELHRATMRPGDRLVLEQQDEVAARLGDDDVIATMTRIAEAARQIGWLSDDAWDRHHRSPSRLRRRSTSPFPLDGPDLGLTLTGSTVTDSGRSSAPVSALDVVRVAGAAARTGARLDRAALERLSEATPPPAPWPPELLAALVDLLGLGLAAVETVENLDRVNLISLLIPEWAPTRSRPQRNPYHRWTVDRHLLETVAEAAELGGRTTRPDLLTLGALFHDLGKAHPGPDHAEVGRQLVEPICTRLGLGDADTATIAFLVQHHLLLPEVATRRDLDDPITIGNVADVVATADRLALLAALTEADARATGPTAWTTWKAGLVADLVDRVNRHLHGHGAGATERATFPDRDLVSIMRARRRWVSTGPREITVVEADRPGLFARVAGVLALNGLAIVDAVAHTESGMACERFTVAPVFGDEISWAPVTSDLHRVLDGRLALRARLATRAETYERNTIPSDDPVAVECDPHGAATTTLIEVRAPDGIGLLYRLATALNELDLDIRTAKVATVGREVIDTFYVADREGGKVEDPGWIDEIRRALMHAATP